MRIDEENQKIQITANQVQWAGKVEITKVTDFFHWNYVAVWASVIIWVPKSGESKSGQMVSEKVIWS